MKILIFIVLLTLSAAVFAGGTDTKPNCFQLTCLDGGTDTVSLAAVKSPIGLPGGTDTMMNVTEGGTDTIFFDTNAASKNIRALKYYGETDNSVVVMVNNTTQLVEIGTDELQAVPALYDRVIESAQSDAWVQAL